MIYALNTCVSKNSDVDRAKAGRGREETYVVPSDIDLWELEKPVTLGTRLDNFLQDQVHPVVAVGKVAVEGLAVLELDKHRMALGRR